MSGFTLTPQIEGMDAEALPQLIPIFLEDCRKRQLAAKSLEIYTDQLGYFARWFEEYGPLIDHKISIGTLSDYAHWLSTPEAALKGKPLADNNRSQILKRLRQLFHWSNRQGYIERDIATWVPSIAMQPRAMQPISVDDICYLFFSANMGHRRIRLRNMAMLALLVATGARRGEIFGIEKKHIDFRADGSGTIYLPASITKFSKPRTVLFCDVCGAFLAKWIENRDNGSIWDEGNAMTLYFALGRLSERASIDRIGPHQLRKFYASYFYAENQNAGDFSRLFLQMQLGHQTTGVTDRNYVFLKSDQIWRWYISPLQDPKIKPVLMDLIDIVEVLS